MKELTLIDLPRIMGHKDTRTERDMEEIAEKDHADWLSDKSDKRTLGVKS